MRIRSCSTAKQTAPFGDCGWSMLRVVARANAVLTGGPSKGLHVARRPSDRNLAVRLLEQLPTVDALPDEDAVTKTTAPFCASSCPQLSVCSPAIALRLFFSPSATFLFDQFQSRRDFLIFKIYNDVLSV